MLHTQIEHDEIIERYVRGGLTPTERQAFEEHYFACDECFEKVQAMEQFAAGIRDAARSGELETKAAGPASFGKVNWAFWTISGASFAAILLALVAGWAYLHTIPALRQELSAATGKTQLSSPNVAQLHAPGNPSGSPEANVPLVMLESPRGEQATIVSLAPDSRQLILWAEIGPTRYRSYKMDVYSASGSRILTINGLTRGPYGALAASVPTEQLQPGTFRITLTGQTPSPAFLVSEYRLQIRRP